MNSLRAETIIGLGISSLDAASRINVLIGEASSLKDTYNALLQLAVREPENGK